MGGTIYLEDIDSLSSFGQSLLLEKIYEVEKAYKNKEKALSKLPRIIASSKQSLFEAVQAKNFSEQLFFKLSSVVIKVPSLEERGTDVLTIANNMLDTVNNMRGNDPSYAKKRFAPSAEDFVLTHKWTGNLLELETTIKKVALNTPRETITEEDMFISMVTLPDKGRPTDNVLNQPLGDELKLRDIVKQVARHYLLRAEEKSKDNPTSAYKLVGLSNHQTFGNWYCKYVKQNRN